MFNLFSLEYVLINGLSFGVLCLGLLPWIFPATLFVEAASAVAVEDCPLALGGAGEEEGV